jgi:hypothetical protein
MKIKTVQNAFLLLTLLLANSCITQFIPVINEPKELLVVQGLITDQPEADTIKLSKSLPLGEASAARPVSGCSVLISDNLGNMFNLIEVKAGSYITPALFHGIIGRKYTLHIAANSAFNNFHFESEPMEMVPVPPIDTIYYNKTIIEKADGFFKGIDGCQIYLDTHDPENKCRYFRWDFSETWILRLLSETPNNTCWVSDRSHNISIKSTAAFDKSEIVRNPVTFINNETDRLKIKYSILVNQYSMNEAEYIYWEKIQNIAVEVGGLYDVIPSSVPSNINCIENPEEKVLGYFSVSAKSSRRIFIKDNFEGIINKYSNCVTDTIYSENVPGLNVNIWILISHKCSVPCSSFFEATTIKGCADCTVRGSNVKPGFWKDDK